MRRVPKLLHSSALLFTASSHFSLWGRLRGVGLAAISRAMQSVEARTVGSSTFHFRASLSSLRARAGRDTLTRAGARTRDRNHMVRTCWPERPYTDRTAPHVAVLQHFEVSC